jgi:hypothetical protein
LELAREDVMGVEMLVFVLAAIAIIFWCDTIGIVRR